MNIPKNPLNDSDVDGNTMAWMKDKECGCNGCGCEDEENAPEDQIDEAEYKMDDR